MCSCVKNAVQTGSDNDGQVEATTKNLLEALGLDTSGDITEKFFVQQLQKAYKKDRTATYRAVRKTLKILSSQAQQVRAFATGQLGSAATKTANRHAYCMHVTSSKHTHVSSLTYTCFF